MLLLHHLRVEYSPRGLVLGLLHVLLVVLAGCELVLLFIELVSFFQSLLHFVMKLLSNFPFFILFWIKFNLKFR